MKFFKTFIITVAALMLLSLQTADANQNLVLTDSVKQSLISAKPVMDRNVKPETFDGKPVLVVFFASW